MSTHVTDIRSNPQTQIEHAARIVGRSRHRQMVFAAIYMGKKKLKTLKELMDATGLNNIRVLQEGGKLAGNNLVGVKKIDGLTAYVKDPYFSQHRDQILKLARNKSALDAFPTEHKGRHPPVRIVLNLPRKSFRIHQVTIDDIQSFESVKKQHSSQTPSPIEESNFKNGVKDLIGEEGEFQDWGGESNDLLTTRLLLDGKRITAVFGFKGKATQGILTPRKMGKNADQIQRLFRSPASLFVVQHWNQIDQSILEQLQQFAIAKSSLFGDKIYYGIIDGTDTQRLIAAYPQYFRNN